MGERTGDYIELQRRAIAVVRMWDALARCEDEFEPNQQAACGEFAERLDTAILGLMRLADRPLWERREQMMRDARHPAVAAEHGPEGDGG